MLQKFLKRKMRHSKIRSKIFGTSKKPRLSVYKSNNQIYAQIIDDEARKTLCSASDLKITKGTKIEKATKVGEDIGKKAVELGIKTCVFDRGGFIYIGRVKSLAEAARKNGLLF